MKKIIKKISLIIAAVLMAVSVAAPVSEHNKSSLLNEQTVLASRRHHHRHHRHHRRHTRRRKHYIYVTYTLKNFKKRIGHKHLHVKRGTSVLGALEKCWKVRYTHGRFGDFVTSIHGYRENKGRNIYWTYKVNGKYANKAANVWKLHNKNHVIWTRSRY